jgi:hypothetical protein
MHHPCHAKQVLWIQGSRYAVWTAAARLGECSAIVAAETPAGNFLNASSGCELVALPKGVATMALA